jgi:hypothetical protein
MLDFSALLKDLGLDPLEVLLIRHTPKETKLRRIFPWIAAERPDLFLAWQQVQWPTCEKAMLRARYVAAFVGDAPGLATFAGLSAIAGHRPIDQVGYDTLPGNAELIARGMTPWTAKEGEERVAFELEPVSTDSDWFGRLVINWPPPNQNWFRWAGRNAFRIRYLVEESRFVGAMPAWDELVLTWPELASLPSSWAGDLAQWRGVYLVFDAARDQRYVGSAAGSENLLGRWRDYATSGHGGNVGLRASRPENLHFSILERTSPDLELAAVVERETSWKRRLHTRAHGLNAN